MARVSYVQCDKCGKQVHDFSYLSLDDSAGVRLGDVCLDCARLWLPNNRLLQTEKVPNYGV